MKKTLLLLFAIIFCIATLPLKNVSAQSSEYNISDYEWEVLYIANAERAEKGIFPLSTFYELQTVAHTRASEITILFEHTRPDGSDCFSIFDEHNIPWNALGENIAAGQNSPEDVMASWMSSSGHRQNILSKKFAHMGVGFETADDSFHEYWVQCFVSGTGYKSMTVKQISPCTLLAGHELSKSECLCYSVELETNNGYKAVLPLMPQFISGIDTNEVGVQTATVSLFGLTAEINLTFNKGDVNSDGILNTGDAVHLLKYCVGLVSFNDRILQYADLNGDGRVNSSDAVGILRLCV